MLGKSNFSVNNYQPKQKDNTMMQGAMKWMRQMALQQLQQRFPDRFKADFGMLPQEMHARCEQGGTEPFKDAVKQKAMQYRQSSPQAWDNAQHTAQQGNFPGSSEPRKEQETQLQLERTQQK